MSRVSVSFDAFSNGFCVFYFFLFVFPTVCFLKLNRFSFSFLILVSFSPFVCPFFGTQEVSFLRIFSKQSFCCFVFLIKFSSLFRFRVFLRFLSHVLSRWNNGSSFSFLFFCLVEN